MKQAYLETISLIERLHRECLEVIKADLDRQGVRDLNNVQAMILFNIGKDTLSVGELTNRGYYLGSNVSYNVKKMVENGYLLQERSAHDRRAVHVKLSPKALVVCDRMHDMYDRHLKAMSNEVASQSDLEHVNTTLRKLERFWGHGLNYAMRTA
ncbi:MarR family winged helix-turn-helix transcriptional regulator [Dongia soli]|uniref:Winged helix DNA-binding protein n=1 Tax=Dongia soli TaxID=600628 RepID=A0ABU5EAE6_9PROT|nr:winged helix DNA-binding protein [Dongia soli]MDY0883247.1 winged helix DNA-binding protein [Dongia soli]